MCREHVGPNDLVADAGHGWLQLIGLQLCDFMIGVLLAAGDLVAADLRLVEVAELRIDESLLTGESTEVFKQSCRLDQVALPVADQANMAFRGSLVTHGRARGVVVATGMRSQIGSIAAMLVDRQPTQTPLQVRLAALGRRLALVVLAICALFLCVGLLRGEPSVQMFLTAVSLAVAAIPEALPAVITVSLALGARRMSRHAALIHTLPAVEALGLVSTICSDKTGTLTQNRMRVECFRVGDESKSTLEIGKEGSAWHLLGQGLALSNDVRPARDRGLLGDPTEVALYGAAPGTGRRRRSARSSRCAGGPGIPRLGVCVPGSRGRHVEARASLR